MLILVMLSYVMLIYFTLLYFTLNPYAKLTQTLRKALSPRSKYTFTHNTVTHT